MNDIAPRVSRREVLPDLVRAVALMGIAVVNAALFAHPMETGLYGDPVAQDTDYNTAFGMYWLAAGKFYALFSLMFGVSLFYQQAAAERAGADLSRRQARRLIGLGVIGLLHYSFFFLGDILVTYAILGALLLTQINQSAKFLLRLGLALILVQVLVLLAFSGLFAGLEALKPGLMAAKMAPMTAEALEVFRNGSFLDQSFYRIAQYPNVLPGVLFSQGIATFGYFCIGLAFARRGWIADPGAAVWNHARVYYLLPALLLGAVGAWLVMDATSAFDGLAMLGLAVLFLAAPGQSIGYAGLLAALARKPGAIVRFVSRAGQASLSAYLLQSIVLSAVFSSWGLGLYGDLTAGPVIAIGAATALFTIVLTAAWMSFFSRGPVESLLRAWTYS